MIKTEAGLAGPERLLVQSGENYVQLQRDVDKVQRVQWIEELAPWEVMTTMTFRWEASVWSAMRTFKKVMGRRLPGVSYYAVTERNGLRGAGHHLHSLWADCRGVWRTGEWQNWLKRYGRARIDLVRKTGDVASYASKYLSKEDSHLEIKLQSHHRSRINGAPFKLA